MAKRRSTAKKETGWLILGSLTFVVVAGAGASAQADPHGLKPTDVTTTTVAKTKTAKAPKGDTKPVSNRKCFTRSQWAHDFLKASGLPDTDENTVAVVAWEIAEGGGFPVPGTSRRGAEYNPINTTLGSKYPSYNSVHVRNFPDYATGVDHNARTVRQSNMSGIYRAFSSQQSPTAIVNAIASSVWGTSGVIRQSIPEAKRQVSSTRSSCEVSK
jgi:hypothetical protein